ncbi:hypothetical protein V6N13_110553 [Hibiscus sabdariffa]|uniref:Uncharacterized protein n=1 Tax=Hibiscus sabdariffa TaxID=183260 RepID=A0ABR2THY7_9ROSI
MHETNSVGGNPTVDLISDTGGRPSEPLTDLGSLLVLERLTATPGVEDQPSLKKSKNTEGILGKQNDDTVVSDMERVVADELRTPSGEVSSDLDNLLQASYMEVATKKSVPIGSGGLGFGFDLDMDTMKVLDKDCLVSEEGAFPTIRRKGDSKGKSKAKLACGKDLDPLHGKHAMVVNNAAYLASYPYRKPKKVGSKVERTNKTTLVPMDECVSVKIVEHVIGNGIEGHKGISIVEHGFEGSNCPIEALTTWSQRMANYLSQVVASSLDALHPLQGAQDTYDVNSSDDSDPKDGVDHMDDASVQDSFA